MNFKRLITGAAVMIASLSTTASAQAEWYWDNVIPTSNGFSAELFFRNVNKYGDPNILAIGTFGVWAKQHIYDKCIPALFECRVNGLTGSTTGNVQRSMFYAGTTQWREGWSYVPITSSIQYQMGVPWYLSLSGNENLIGVLGCQVPETATGFADYGYRTCAADGYDGWISVPVSMSLFGIDDPVGTYGVDDVFVGFDMITLQGPNAMQVVPEPSTYALMAIGLGAIVLVRRKRRAI